MDENTPDFEGGEMSSNADSSNKTLQEIKSVALPNIDDEDAEDDGDDDDHRDPADLGDEISVDELGIDLYSLQLSGHTLGRAKPKPALTDSSDKRAVGRPPKEDEGLFAWCEQWSYTPGVEFLKLHRDFPKLWEGININGFVEEIYEPVDEHWLADRWGGGSYHFDVYQRDTTGRSRKSGTKFVEISGVPHAYMGQDGNTYELPSRNNNRHSSRRSGDVLRRRMGLGKFNQSSGRYDHLDEERPARPVTAHIDVPLADASTIYKVMQDSKKSENDALGVLREAQKDVHHQMQATANQQAEMYRTLLEQQKEEMRRMREESRSVAETSSAPFREMLQFMATQGSASGNRENLETLRQAHDTAVTQLTREHSSHLDDMRRGYESRLSQLMEELNRLRTDYTQGIERIRSDYMEKEKSAKDDAFRTYQAQMEIIRSQNSEMRERHRDELSNAMREKNEIIAQLRQDSNELRQTLNQKDHEHRTSILEERQRMREEFEDRYTAKMESFRESADLRASTAEQQAKTSIESRNRELEAQYGSIVAKLEAQIEALKQEHRVREQLSLERSRLEHDAAQKERENQRMIMESTSQSREALAEMTRKQLELRVKELESRKGVDASDPFAQLERVHEIKERLKRHGFIDHDERDTDDTESAPKEEEKPKDFFGKLMHYGPQFVGPILQRIDAATSVAQQAVQHQQAQDIIRGREEMAMHQRQLELERVASQERQEMLRQRREMLLQRREARDSEDAEQRAQFAQRLEQQRQEQFVQANNFEESPMPPPPQPQPYQNLTQEELHMELTPNETEGYSKLADYLFEAMKANKKPSAIVKELKMALMMGMISRDMIDDVLSKDFNDLVGIMQMFHPDLATPKSKIALKTIMEGMK